MGAELAVMAAITVASTAASIAASAQQGSASRKQAAYMNAQQAAAYAKSVAVNQAQSSITAQERRRQLQARYDAMKGAMAVSSGERGVAEGRSSQLLANALGIQVAKESAKISMENALNQQSFAASNQPMWQVGQSTSPFLAGIQGGLQGLGLGLGVADSMRGLNAANQLQAAGAGSYSVPSFNVPGPAPLPNF